MEFKKCATCGMNLLSSTDYHPHVACQLFRQTHSSDKVESGLKSVIEYGMKAQKLGLSSEQAMRDITKVIK